MSPRKVPVKGPEVFVPHDPTKGKTVLVRVGGKCLKARMPNEPVVRDTVTDDEYCGEKPKGDAA